MDHPDVSHFRTLYTLSPNRIPRRSCSWTTLGEQFEVLADKRRRRPLVALLKQDPQDEVQIPEDVHGGDEELELLQAEMFHAHLPMLEEAGFVRWNRDAPEVLEGPRFEEIRRLLELLDAHADELPADWP